MKEIASLKIPAALVALSVALLSGRVAYAAPVTYDITFTPTFGGPPPASGMFTYDPTSGLFSDFKVQWNGVTFDLVNGSPSGANDPLNSNGTIFQTACNATEGALAFDVLSHASCITNNLGSGSLQWGAQTIEGGPGFFVFLARDLSANGGILDDLSFSGELFTTPSNAYAAGSWSIAPASVPEPATLGLLGLGLAVAGVARRKRKS